MSFLVIDHQDSFTYNLVHLLEHIDSTVEVIDYSSRIVDHPMAQDCCLVFSPGPGRPDDYPFTKKLYAAKKGQIPIIGVCLGFQIIVSAEGGSIIRQPKVMHGVQGAIAPTCSGKLYDGITELSGGRYHSLQADLSTFPSSLTITALDDTGTVPLSFESKENQVYGFQYHPDSFLTPNGLEILRNIFR
jgi:anthranilate synthase/aminodeoxychorismate synthase-like glutamine amidotransferase